MAENIAYGYSTAAAVMDGLLNSSGHRANIETGLLVHLGVGHASNYWAQDFIGGSSCSYSGLSFSQSSVTGRVGQDLEDILTDADITVTANCAQHGTSYLPLIAAMCSGYDANTAGAQAITVNLNGKSTILTVTLTGGQTAGTPSTEQPTTVVDRVGQIGTLPAGSYHAGAIDENGALWVWGFGGNGRLGTGTTESSSTPVKVLDNVTAVSCGNSYTAAVKSDGTLWTWGSNASGQLGTGTAADCQGSSQAAGLTVKLPGTTSVTASPKIAYATSYSILVDGKPVAFDAYALRDENNNDTNYLKLRDVAYVLNGSAAQFNVGWDNDARVIVIDTTRPYSE